MDLLTGAGAFRDPVTQPLAPSSPAQPEQIPFVCVQEGRAGLVLHHSGLGVEDALWDAVTAPSPWRDAPRSCNNGPP